MKDWFQSPAGRALLVEERRRCVALTPPIYYPRSLQVGLPSMNFLDGLESGARFFIGDDGLPDAGDGDADEMIHRAVARASAMPFTGRTHNLIILPHTLDFCDDPNAVLREVSQVLEPQGCVVVTGFNRWSLWRIVRLLIKKSHRPPNRHQSVGRVQGQLSALGFELVGAAMLGYRPPVRSEQWKKRLAFLEDVGERWLPGLGAVFVIVARKHEIAPTGVATARLRWRQLLPDVAQPATREGLARTRKKQ